MAITNARVLVTGGTGFVGGHLVEALLKQDAFVVTTYLSHKPLSYFSFQKLNQKTTMVQADVADAEKMRQIVVKYDIEYIFHLAAQPIVDTAFYNPLETINTNIMGTVAILEAARLYPRLKGVIIASSDKAYGKLNKESYTEADQLKGDHPYDVSKSSADLITTAYAKTYGLPVVTTRFGNIYGEGDLNFSRIIPGILRSIIANNVLEIRSNGKYIRDYLYVKDVVDGYILLANNIEKTKGEAFNFGSKDRLSVLDLVKVIQSVLHKKVEYKVLNTAKNEIPYQALNDDKIKQTLNWQNTYTIENTIAKIYKWYIRALYHYES